MGMKVKIAQSCERCARQAEIEIDSDNLGAIQAEAEGKRKVLADVQKFFDSLGTKAPDLVVLFKGKVQHMNNVCAAHCVKAVQNQLTNAFRVAKPRKTRVKKTQPTASLAAV